MTSKPSIQERLAEIAGAVILLMVVVLGALIIYRLAMMEIRDQAHFNGTTVITTDGHECKYVKGTMMCKEQPDDQN